MGQETTFDAIVVGAGAAGCVLANRLSADPRRSILLLEAGPDFGPDPATWPAELLDPSSIRPDVNTWGYVDSGPHLNAPFDLPRSRVVGGTTTVNGCVWLRGSASDYDGWGAAGNSGWSFGELLPYFQRAEADPLHGSLAGTFGPVPVFREALDELPPAERAFIEAAESLGFPYAPDLNATASQRPCVGPAPKNIADGARMNGSFTYLTAARGRPNLQLRADALVDRIIIQDGRATGVQLAGGERFLSREVILCCGAYGSPAILMRSGIGPASHLEVVQIPVTVDLPGVGENLLDHPRLSPDRPLPRFVRPECAPAKRSFIPIIAKAASRHAGDEIDLHIYIGQDFSVEFGAWFLWITASLQFARSRGRVRLTARAPEAPLDIDHNYLNDPADLEALCDGIDLIETMMATPEMQAVLQPVTEEAPPWGDRSGLSAWAREHFATTYHPSSTCRMGPASDHTAVVDAAGCAHGISGLRVVDASIFPTGPRANIHFSVVAAAEKLAQAILDDEG